MCVCVCVCEVYSWRLELQALLDNNSINYPIILLLLLLLNFNLWFCSMIDNCFLLSG